MLRFAQTIALLLLSAQTGDADTTLSFWGDDSGYNTFDSEDRVVVTNQAMGARCAVAADFDGDGRLDIVSASSNDNAVSWFHNEGLDAETGLPVFGIKQEISWASLGSRIVTVADIDSDGDMDVVGASYYDKSLRWYENDGTGSFTEHLISTGVIEGQGVAVADLDNNGMPDIISASSGDNTIAVFKNLDHGIFCEIKDVVDDNAIGARTAIAADLNGDGWIDIASASKDDDTVAWYPNDGTGHFPTKLIVSAGNESKGAYSLVAADIDQDGDQDLIVASNGNDRVTIWRNDGNGEFTQTIVFDSADFVLSVTAVDFDLDGDLDIASASFFDGYINWYENVDGEGYEWRNHTIYVGLQGHYVSHADIDGDGDNDLIAVTHAENTVAIFLAQTRCDKNQTADCCLVGTEWNGTACAPCGFGYYGSPNGGCSRCPKNSCRIEGLNHLPHTCPLPQMCEDVENSIAACSCAEDFVKDPESDTCVACPDGQIRPDLGLQRQPDTLGNYSVWELEQGTCYVYQPTDRKPVIISVSVLGSLLLVAVGILAYKQWQLAKKNSLWKIRDDELVYDNVVLGSGSFGKVVLANYKGTKVAVKTMQPKKLKKAKKVNENPSAQEASDGHPGDSQVDEEQGGSSTGTGGLSTGTLSFVRGNSSVGSVKGTSKLFVSTKSFTQLPGRNKSKRDLMRDEFVREIRLLSQLPVHRNIVCVVGAVAPTGQDPKLVMEFMERGSLRDMLKSTIPIGGQLILNIMKDVINGLRFLHNIDPEIIHSDLKSSNILIDERFRAKISDFGWGTAGTPFWTAPEVLRGESRYTTESDVYAFGITMYEIYSREYPYEGKNSKAVLRTIKKKYKHPRTPRTMSQKIAFMYKDCLHKKAFRRPSTNELASRIDRLTLDEVKYQTGEEDDNKNVVRSSEPMLFPSEVAEALGKGNNVEPVSHPAATVFYCEIANYSTLTGILSPAKLGDLIHRLFDRVDALAKKYGVFKVDMMAGGGWMGATNVIKDQAKDSVIRIAQFASEVMEAAGATVIDEDDLTHGFVQIRAGFVTGCVEGRVIGTLKPRYGLFGPAVEAATFLASKSDGGHIVCVEADQAVLEQKAPNISFDVKARVFVPGFETLLTIFSLRKS